MTAAEFERFREHFWQELDEICFSDGAIDGQVADVEAALVSAFAVVQE